MEGKRQVMMNNGAEIIRYLYNIIGCDNFLGFIKLMMDENYLDKKLAQNLTKPFQQKEKKDRSTFQELIKEQRKKANNSKEDGTAHLVLISEKENNQRGEGSLPNEVLNPVAKKISF